MSEPSVSAPEARQNYLTRRGSAALWLGLLGAPGAFLFHLVVNYFLVSVVCFAGVEWPLHVVTLLALGGCAAAAFHGWSLRVDTDEHLIAKGLGRIERSRFLANVGLLATALFTLLILVQWVGILVFHPCDRL